MGWLFDSKEEKQAAALTDTLAKAARSDLDTRKAIEKLLHAPKNPEIQNEFKSNEKISKFIDQQKTIDTINAFSPKILEAFIAKTLKEISRGLSTIKELECGVSKDTIDSLIIEGETSDRPLSRAEFCRDKNPIKKDSNNNLQPDTPNKLNTNQETVSKNLMNQIINEVSQVSQASQANMTNSQHKNI